MTSTPESKALHIDRFPADVRADIDKIARHDGFSLRVTAITLIREAIRARKEGRS